MTRPQKKKKVEKALRTKGFTQTRQIGRKKQKHIKYELIYEGMRTGILTMLSHEAKSIGPSLLTIIRKELKMPDLGYLKSFIDCSVTYGDYVEYLLEQSFLNMNE